MGTVKSYRIWGFFWSASIWQTAAKQLTFVMAAAARSQALKAEDIVMSRCHEVQLTPYRMAGE